MATVASPMITNAEPARVTPSGGSVHAARWMLHALCLAICFGIFLYMSLPGMVMDVNLSPPMELVRLATTTPTEIAGGYFDQFNSNLQNVPYIVYGLLRRCFDQPTSAIVLHCGIVAVLIAGVYALSCTLAQSAPIGCAVTSILVNSELLGYPCVGANGFPSQATAPCYLFLGAAMLAVRFLIVGKPYLYAAILPLAFLCHMPQGLLAFVILLPAAWLLAKKNLRFLAVHAGSMLLLAGGFYLYQRLSADVVASGNNDLWFHYLHLLNCGHVYVDYGIGAWAGFFSFLATMLAGAALCAARPESRRFLAPTVAAGVALIAVAQVFIYVTPLRLVYLLMPIRASNLLSALVLVNVLVWLLKMAESGRTGLQIVPLALGLAAAAASGYIGAFLLAVATCAVSAWLSKGWLRFVGAAGLVAILLLWFNLGVEATQQWDAFVLAGRAGLVALLAALAIGCALAVRLTKWSIEQRYFATGFAAALVVASAWSPHIVDYSSPSFQPMAQQLAEYQRLGAWFHEHTEPGEIALVPPDCFMPFFEVVARRGSLLQLSKASWVYSSPHLLEKFDLVLRDFDIDLKTYKSHREIWTRPRESWKSLSASRFQELAAKYKAPYLVTYADHQLDLPIALRGEHFVVYDAATAQVSSRPRDGISRE